MGTCLRVIIAGPRLLSNPFGNINQIVTNRYFSNTALLAAANERQVALGAMEVRGRWYNNMRFTYQYADTRRHQRSAYIRPLTPTSFCTEKLKQSSLNVIPENQYYQPNYGKYFDSIVNRAAECITKPIDCWLNNLYNGHVKVKPRQNHINFLQHTLFDITAAPFKTVSIDNPYYKSLHKKVNGVELKEISADSTQKPEPLTKKWPFDASTLFQNGWRSVETDQSGVKDVKNETVKERKSKKYDINMVYRELLDSDTNEHPLDPLKKNKLDPNIYYDDWVTPNASLRDISNAGLAKLPDCSTNNTILQRLDKSIYENSTIQSRRMQQKSSYFDANKDKYFRDVDAGRFYDKQKNDANDDKPMQKRQPVDSDEAYDNFWGKSKLKNLDPKSIFDRSNPHHKRAKRNEIPRYVDAFSRNIEQKIKDFDPNAVLNNWINKNPAVKQSKRNNSANNSSTQQQFADNDASDLLLDGKNVLKDVLDKGKLASEMLQKAFSKPKPKHIDSKTVYKMTTVEPNLKEIATQCDEAHAVAEVVSNEPTCTPIEPVFKDCEGFEKDLVPIKISSECHEEKKDLCKPQKLQATYIWIDETGLANKDRILNKVPKSVNDVPEWSDANCGDGNTLCKKESEYSLKPKQYYKNPLLPKTGDLLVLCEAYSTDNVPLNINKRAQCLETLTKVTDCEPWFGFVQEYVLLNAEGQPLSWNVAAEANIAQILAQEHVTACLDAGLAFYSNAVQKMPGKWQYKIGPACGLNAADDLWVSRYLLERIARRCGLQVTFDPRCLSRVAMDLCTRVNFSTAAMRSENGLKSIMEAVNKLGESHTDLLSIYKQKPRKKFSWAVGKCHVSVRIPKKVAKNGFGYLEDRRPAGNCDPYEIINALLNTCLLQNEKKFEKTESHC